MIEKTNQLSIVKQCELLNINRSNLYYSPKEASKEDLEIMKLLARQYYVTPFYGYRKMTVWLRKQEFVINEKRVRRLMETVNWKTIYREPRTTVSNIAHEKYPYLLKGLVIIRKNQVWATDITYIPMAKGFMYLCAIMDLQTRFVLNWSVSNTMSAAWCSQVLQETIDEHGAPEIFNTDQGSQYTSDCHVKILKDNNVQISMDGKGRAIDNIFIERLWRTVKYENVYLQAYTNGTSLHKGLKDYFEFYNNDRFHQSLEYQTPAEMYYETIVA